MCTLGLLALGEQNCVCFAPGMGPGHCVPPVENRVRGIKCFQSSQSYLFCTAAAAPCRARQANIKERDRVPKSKGSLGKKVNKTASTSISEKAHMTSCSSLLVRFCSKGRGKLTIINNN